jgi:putative ABC transport system permease protein
VIGLALRLARRDLRGGWKSFRLAMAGLALGVATIAGIGSFGAGLVDGLRENGRVLLGADVALLTTMLELDSAQSAWLEERGTVSQSLEMNAMAVAGQEPPLLVSLKAVDDLWPLYGAVTLDPAMPLTEALAVQDGEAGVIADTAFAERLGLSLGDSFTLGSGTFRLNATLVDEPDRASAPFQLGPRVLVSRAGLAGSDLLGPATMARYTYRVKLPEGGEAKAFTDDLDAAWPDAGWRVRSHENANPSLMRFLERLRLFITLVGLAALLVGGIGVASAVRTYLERKTGAVAIFKALGAPSRLIFTIYLIEVAAMATVGVVLGLIAGALLPPLIGGLAQAALPVPVVAGVYPLPLALAAAFGMLTALVFALLPLAATRDVPAAALLRERGGGSGGGRPRRGDIALVALLAAALAGLAVAASADRVLAAAFVAGAAVALVLFRLAGTALIALLARVRHARSPVLRLALGGLVRPGAATGAVVVAFGIGLTVLTAVAGVQANLREEIGATLPENAPAFFFIDIQPDQIGPFRQLAEETAGVTAVESVPSLRGRIMAINGVPVGEAQIDPSVRWAADGDRGVTYAAEAPDNADVVAGEWWPADYAGPPMLSFDAEIAEGFGIGDTLTVNVMGRDITATIANLRRIDWATMGINFVLVFAPGTMEAAPHTHIATVHAAASAESPLRSAVARDFPNVSAIGVRDVLGDVLAILSRIDAAIGGIAGLALLAGIVVLAEAVAAQQRRRVYDAAVMKVLGATRRQLATAFTIEHLILGGATAVLALILGGLAAWGVVRFVLGTSWMLPWGPLLGVAALALCVSLVAGIVASWRALARPAAPILRGQ